MPVFLERMILPALAAVLVILGVTNPLNLDWQARVGGSLVVLAIGLAVSWIVHRSNQKAKSGPSASGVVVPTSAVPTPSIAAPPEPSPPPRVFMAGSVESLIGMAQGLTGVQSKTASRAMYWEVAEGIWGG